MLIPSDYRRLRWGPAGLCVWLGLHLDLMVCFFMFLNRQDKESKEEVLKVEKELEEIRKAVEESAGKLTNRSLQCQVCVCVCVGVCVGASVCLSMLGHVYV